MSCHLTAARHLVLQRADLNEAVHRDWYEQKVKPILVSLLANAQERLRDEIWFVWQGGTVIFGCRNTRKQMFMDLAIKKIGDDENPENAVLRRLFTELGEILEIARLVHQMIAIEVGEIGPIPAARRRARQKLQERKGKSVGQAESKTSCSGSSSVEAS